VDWRQCLEWKAHVGTISQWLSKEYKNLPYYQRMASCISPPKILRPSQAKKELFLHLRTDAKQSTTKYRLTQYPVQGVANSLLPVGNSDQKRTRSYRRSWKQYNTMYQRWSGI
jgi:hypothetical protein